MRGDKSGSHLPQTGNASHNGTDASQHADEAVDQMETLSSEFEHLELWEQKANQRNKPGSCPNQPTEEEDDDDDSDTFWYTFTEDVFTSGKGPAVICGYCEQEGHIKANCPDDKLPVVKPLPPMTSDHLNTIDRVVAKIIYDFSPTDLQLRLRERVVRDLESFVRQIYPDARFSLFGSSCNGFGFHSSDLDICMTLKGKAIEDIDVVETIETVAKKLMQRRQLYNVISIPTAKVPIVKFTDRETRLDGDISLYNTLAQRNTKLLWCYSEIDQRVRILGYAVKVFAKVCYIGDASRGSLSSYGYILMMLHYLQQCNPPVIPVLQELRPEGEWPECMVEGCNTWFFDDLRQLSHRWRDHRKNTQSVGDLWMGFLRFYLEDFDWKGMVVTVRQSARLTKFEKMWTGKTIAVEDPFDLNHNLGGGLSRKMNNYIYKTFVKGRSHFGTPVVNREVYIRYPGPSDYFFDVDLLTDGKPPNDRGCRMCGKIGHLVKDCPNRPGNKRRQQVQKEKETKPTKNSPHENSPEKKDAKGQGSVNVKGQEDVKGQGGAQSRGLEESRYEGKARSKGQEKAKDQKGVKSKDGEEAKGQDNGQVVGQGRSKQGSASSVDGNGYRSVGKGDAAHRSQLSTPAKATSAITMGGLTNTTNTTTTTAASSPANITTTTTSSGSTPKVPPGFGSAAGRSQFHPDRPSQHPLPSASHSASEGLPRPQTSTPLRTVKPGMRPPGIQMDIQQLFNMVQQSSGSPVSLSSHKQPPQSPTRQSPNRLLTPEQQVAIFGGQSLVQGTHSPGSPQQLGASSPSGKGAPDAKMTPVSLMSLFQQPQSPTSSAEPAQAASSQQQMTPLPLQSLFPPSSQLPSGGGSPGRPGAETGYAPKPMTPVPLQSLFSGDASQSPALQQQQQQAMQQQQIMQTLMQMVPGQNPPSTGAHAQNPPASSHHPPATSVAHQSQAVSSQNQPSSFHHPQMSFAQQQRQPVGSQQHHQNQPAGSQQPPSQQTGFKQHQSQPSGFQQHQSQSAAFQQPQSQPAGFQQPQSQPTGFQQHQGTSSGFQQPQSQPAGFQQHQGPSSGFQQPQSQPAGFQQHQSSSAGFQKPQSQPAGFQQHQSSSAGFQQPQSQPAGFQQPQSQPAGFQQPQSQSGGVQHQGQPMGLQPHHSQPMAMQPHQSQPISSQAPAISPQLQQQQQQIAYMQLQQHMAASMSASGAPLFGQSPPGIYSQPMMTGFPLFQMGPGEQNQRRDGSSSSSDTTGQGSPRGNP